MIKCVGLKLATCIVGGLFVFLVAPISAAAEWHVVQPGETLWAIGDQYNTDAIDIADANGITDTNLIHVGDELWIPDATGSGTGGDPVIHVVVSGDNMAAIAASYGVDTNSLAMLNSIETPYLIYPGQEITIPYAELPVQPPPADPIPAGNIDPAVGFVDTETIRQTIISLSQEYGWDAHLIQSLAWAESTWDQRALSPSGAVGVMQLMPTTADWAGPALVGRDVDYVNNVTDNVETGIAYLSHLRVITGSDYLALAAYFQGLASVEQDGIFPTTRAYALGIIESRDLFASGALP